MEFFTKEFFVEMFKYSPFVTVMIIFLIIVWRSLGKKDKALIDMMRENSASQLQLTRESITAQNAMASSNLQVAGAIEKVHEGQRDIRADIESLKGRSLNGRKVTGKKPTATA
ncbi:hypothetical protein [Spirosoma sordidisoli]|uniref:Uncharacterized protein n=1 Tax=Spirosoma sordidisoli TaxID=2502893 RepID=A0A4Q2USD9_9BACT|nr:hypothetical protein [Spirosoma sordidisoli]RYC69749.1 hypothetical protein EQG79_14230 [Spirosoma sordidisoli]